MKRKPLKKTVTYIALGICLIVACTVGGIKKFHSIDQYGVSAYTYVQYLQKNLGYRLAGTKMEQETCQYIKKELKKMGYTEQNLEEQSFTFTDAKAKSVSQNIIATKPGRSDKEIVVGIHYDSVSTFGVDDNGSGVAVALECAKRVTNRDVPYTIKFLFFGAEEAGLYGSKYYVDSLGKEEKSKIQLMVNIDSILAGDKQYIYGGSVGKNGKILNAEAVEKVKELAKQLRLDIYMNPGKNKKYKPPTTGDWSDHVSFKNLGIPYVYFEAGNWDLGPLDGSWQTKKMGEIMHTSNDDLNIINKNFPDRAKERLRTFTTLLDNILKAPESLFAKKSERIIEVE